MMILATVVKLTVPVDAATVAVVLEVLDESTKKVTKATIDALVVKTLASMDRMPQIGDMFNLNMWRIV